MSRCVCVCRCHEDETGGPGAVVVTDPIAAAAACPRCLAHHAPALSSTQLANELEVKEGYHPDPTAWADSDGTASRDDAN